MGRDSCGICKKKKRRSSKHHRSKKVIDCCDKPYCVKICNTPFKPKNAFLVFPCTRYFGFNNAIMYNDSNEPIIYKNENSCFHDPQECYKWFLAPGIQNVNSATSDCTSKLNARPVVIKKSSISFGANPFGNAGTSLLEILNTLGGLNAAVGTRPLTGFSGIGATSQFGATKRVIQFADNSDKSGCGEYSRRAGGCLSGSVGVLENISLQLTLTAEIPSLENYLKLIGFAVKLNVEAQVVQLSLASDPEGCCINRRACNSCPASNIPCGLSQSYNFTNRNDCTLSFAAGNNIVSNTIDVYNTDDIYITEHPVDSDFQNGVYNNKFVNDTDTGDQILGGTLSNLNSDSVGSFDKCTSFGIIPTSQELGSNINTTKPNDGVKIGFVFEATISSITDNETVSSLLDVFNVEVADDSLEVVAISSTVTPKYDVCTCGVFDNIA